MIISCILFLAQQVSVVDDFPLCKHLGAIQLDASKQLHLIAINDERLSVVGSDQTIDFPGLATLYTIIDFDGDGYEELWVLNDGQQLQQLQQVDGQLLFADPIATRLQAMPPAGYHSAQFLQDFNGDGLVDLLLPISDQVRIHLNSSEGFQNGLDLGALSDLSISNGNSLLSKTGRTLSVPGLRPEDVSGDGLPDLVISENGYIRQYVATPEGFPATATRTLNTFDFAKDTSEYEFNLSNLSAGAAYLVQDKWADFDADGDIDVMILADYKVRIFLGDENGINLDEERQRLKVRGNVVYLFPARIDDDKFPDLVIVRIEDLGLGKILRAALMSWEIKFDFMVFKGRGDGLFNRRAFRSRSAVLQGDSLISTYKRGKADLAQMRKKIVRTCDLDGDGKRNDMVMLDAGGELRAFANVVDTPNILHVAIEKFLQQSLAGEGELELEISTLSEWMLGRTSAMASLAKGKIAIASTTLEDWETPHAMLIRDFDGDGCDEALILRNHKTEDKQDMLRGVLVDFN
ncbi:MAG: hypothetical protein ACI84O_001080 [Myxococcota bacterium]|jgi:hypothetical protein